MQSVDEPLLAAAWWGWRLPAAYRGALTRCRTGAARTGTSGGGCTTQLRVSAINAASEKLLTRLGAGRTFSLVGPVVITVWKCGTRQFWSHFV